MALQVIKPPKKVNRRKRYKSYEFVSMEAIAKHFNVTKPTITRWSTRDDNPMPRHKAPFGKVVNFVIEECDRWYEGE
ncbi:hypothetical protein [Companilactobacillus sp. DQM5]|uniref:hypothetical protein n=1 Tax=Companilactobacillus sp. DQM5 TaxID=3463359 RepID=UPI0040590D03